MKSVTLRAYAKINISLDVTGKREDGYHLLRSVFQGISLYDDIRVIRKKESEGIEITCNLPYIPTDERTIVHKVATAFFKAAGMTDYSIAIDLKKTIPSGAGLGGGSADGAAGFSALCRLYGIFFSKEQATEILTPLGADIPFFLYSGTMLAEGVGEILSPLPALPACFIVLAQPRASANPKQIFSALGKLKEAMQKQGALLSLMTGSGSTVFGIFQEEKDARKAARVMQRYTRTVFTVRPICRPMKTEE